jgi:hypothetical protein
MTTFIRSALSTLAVLVVLAVAAGLLVGLFA